MDIRKGEENKAIGGRITVVQITSKNQDIWKEIPLWDVLVERLTKWIFATKPVGRQANIETIP
nr:hypothetical protein [Virgibacillus pantothenticus]